MTDETIYQLAARELRMQYLQDSEFSLMIESLQYTKRNFENCNSYPSYQFKLDRIGEVEKLIEKLRTIRKVVKNENTTE